METWELPGRGAGRRRHCGMGCEQISRHDDEEGPLGRCTAEVAKLEGGAAIWWRGPAGTTGAQGKKDRGRGGGRGWENSRSRAYTENQAADPSGEAQKCSP